MKFRLLTSFTALLLVALRLSAAGSPFRFDSGSWDWGVIREADGPVTHIFRFVNTSAEPACIWQVNVACGCTRAEWSRFNHLFRQMAALSLLRLHVTPEGSNGILTVSAIGIAVRLSLRTRLTLIRLALIRKP